MNNSEIPVWVILPAAGVGARMGSEYPKQYLPLKDKAIIEWTLELFLAMENVAGVIVSVRSDDQRWLQSRYSHHSRVVTVRGGQERSDSVLSAVNWVYEHQSRNAWVMIHDVVRPCVRSEDLQRLQSHCLTTLRPAILAVPVSDTIKKVDGDLIVDTVERSHLWQAQTPQMFPVEPLKQAFERVVQGGVVVTDDASVMEFVGADIDIVRGHRDNIKVTTPEDLELVEMILERYKC